MVTAAKGLVTLEPISDLFGMYKTRMSNGISEVRAEQPFVVLLTYFGPIEQHWPKGMIVVYDMKKNLFCVP